MRRVRGVAGTMGVWATVFAAVGVVGLIPLSLLGVLPRFEHIRILRILGETVVGWGLGGAGMGLAFATAVLLGERRSAVGALSPLRFATWGSLAGAIVPIGIATVNVLTRCAIPLRSTYGRALSSPASAARLARRWPLPVCARHGGRRRHSIGTFEFTRRSSNDR